MAEQPKSDLEVMAFQIYSDICARTNRGGQELAMRCFEKADAFISVRDQVAKSGLRVTKKSDEKELANCRCPNLPDTHPYNIVSHVKGDRDKINRVHAYLTKHATPTEQDRQPEFVYNFNQEFKGFNWDMPQINVARQILPQYVTVGK